MVNKAMTLAVLAAATVISTSAIAAKAGQTRDRAMTMAQNQFAKLDANADGTVTSDEITTRLQARATSSGKPFKPAMAARMMTRMDANKDGKVTLDEAKAAAGAMFDAADRNKNGTIDADEASAPAGGDAAE